MFKRRKRSDGDEPIEAAQSEETLDAATDFDFYDDSGIAARFGEEAESAWDGMADSPLTGAPGASLSPIPEDLLHSGRVQAVRFQIASPKGYYFPQVEEFVRQVGDALKEWESLVHERDVYIHSLQHELELQRRDVRSLRTQIEIFRVQGDAVVNSDGSYMTESQMPGAPAAQAPVAPMDNEELLYFRERAASLEVANAENMAAIADLEAQLQQAYIQMTDLQNAATATPAQPTVLPDEYAQNLAAWQNAVEERDRIISDLQTEVARLRQAPPAPVQAQQPMPARPTYPPQQPASTPVMPQQAPTRPDNPSMVWTPTSPGIPTQQPDPRLASPGRVEFEDESPLSVWAPDLIDQPLDMSQDADTDDRSDFPDTTFRNR